MAHPGIASQIELQASKDGAFAIAYALLQVAETLADLAVHVKYLGNGNAATQMGAIENLAKEVKEGTSSVAGALLQIAEYMGNIEVPVREP